MKKIGCEKLVVCLIIMKSTPAKRGHASLILAARTCHRELVMVAYDDEYSVFLQSVMCYLCARIIYKQTQLFSTCKISC